MPRSPVLKRFLGLAACAIALPAFAQTKPVLTGQAAFGDWHEDHPGVVRKITAADLAAPFTTRSSSQSPSVVERPQGASPKAPSGFQVSLVAQGLNQPRLIRVAPNGDIFVAESGVDRIRVFPAGTLSAERADVSQGAGQIFAGKLNQPFGIVFFPAGPDPQWVYVADTDSVIRFPYRNGDQKARGPAETILPHLPDGGHWTRDLAVSPDSKQLYLAIGSESNIPSGLTRHDAPWTKQWEAQHGLGAAWDDEENRANLLVMNPDGSGLRSYANGIRNCVSVTLDPATETPWCAVNERDGLGDNLPPDYVTSVAPHAFYGWPWYYIGGHPDPRMKGARPDLVGKVRVPDVLIQPHSAPLQITFYTGAQFPTEYRRDAFVTLHGSWNRAKRTGYKVVRVLFKDGKPTGAYEDFLTGFVVDDESVWGRPVGVATAADGSLLVSEDGAGTIWRVSWVGAR